MISMKKSYCLLSNHKNGFAVRDGWWRLVGPRELGEERYRGTSLIRNSPPPEGHHRALGVVLL